MRKIALLFAIAISGISWAQEFGMSGEVRPRFEARHGFKTLADSDKDPATFVSQRTRINLDFKDTKYDLRISAQNIRVWGDVPTMTLSDKNGTALFEAWGAYHFTEKFSVKLGRQVIAYDDQRILGAVGWAQQARSHDALLLKFKTGEKSNLDVGFAMNANAETLFDEDYLVNQYKNLQYAWYHTTLSETFDLSLLFLNNGMPYDKRVNQVDTEQEVTYSQTLGGRTTFKSGGFSGDAATYFQMGSTPVPGANATGDMDLGAYYFSLNGRFAITSQFTAGAGFEYLSGTDQGSSSNKNKSFTPFYGTNHKFNGLMDYFYVGNHANSVGLLDIYVPLSYKKDKLTLTLAPHYFSSAATILKPDTTKADNYLGTEIDFTASYKLIKSVSISGGYSQMFASDSMEILKGGDKGETNNWAWLMVTFKPNFFKTKINKN